MIHLCKKKSESLFDTLARTHTNIDTATVISTAEVSLSPLSLSLFAASDSVTLHQILTTLRSERCSFNKVLRPR